MMVFYLCRSSYSADPRIVQTVDNLARQFSEYGIVTIPDALPATLIQPVRLELASFGAAPGGRTATAYPLNLARRGKLSRLLMVASVLALPAVRRARAELVPHGWTVSDVIGIESAPSSAPVTSWHADASKPAQQHRIKFYWYLNDVGPENGAFEYVPRSHHLVAHMRRVQAGAKMQVYGDFRAAWQDVALPSDLATLRSEVDSHIHGDNHSDDHYALAQPAGTLIVFDERGLHRGGIVTSGRRSVLRVSFMPPAGLRAVAYRVAAMAYPAPLHHLLASA
jgi:hypothetical protein